MRIMLADGQFIGTDRFISGVLRSDLLPIPVTLEFQTLLTPGIDAQLQEKSVIRIGDNYLELIIVKRVVDTAGFLKDDKLLSIGAYIAVLNGCERLIEPARKATYLEGTTIGAALRASGNKLKVKEDVPLYHYFCAVGATPSYEIARKCGEEAAVIYCSDEGKIIVKRLSQILNQDPALELDDTAVKWIKNQTHLNHVIPSYQTVNADGSTIEGELKVGAKTAFYPNLDSRRLKNLSTVLVTRGTVMRTYNPDFMAGDVVKVKDKKYVILTAAHRFDTGVLGGATVSASKFWLAEVVSL